VRPLAVETGFFRPQPNGEIEVLLTHPTGVAEIYYGTVDGAKIELRTDAVARTASAQEYTAGHRLYGLVEGDLLWTFDMAAMGQSLQSHIWARLQRA
jgi:nitrobindin-like protein